MIEISKRTLYTMIFVSALSIISFFIIKDFIVPIIFTGILVYLFHPLYKKILKIFRNHLITSILIFLLIGLLIIIPMILTISEISKEFSSLKDIQIEQSLDSATQTLNSKYNMNIDLKAEYQNFLSTISIYLTNFLYNKLPSFIFNVFIMMFFFYYFMKNYENESTYFAILLQRIRISKFSYKIKRLINGIIYGQILVRFIQALFGAILLFLIGVKGAFLWGFLMFFASFIPLVGTSLIWGPLVLLNIFLEDYNLALYIFIAGILISVIDNLIFPFIISERINIGPVITLISIIGGLKLFGIYGLILGPFFLGLLFVFLDEILLGYRSDNTRKKRYVWTKQEREKYKSLKTKEAQEEFKRIINSKYERLYNKNNSNNNNNNNIQFRFISED